MPNVPFPQADDFDKIISIINVNNTDYLQDAEGLSMLLDGITIRQIHYYLSAVEYLGIIDHHRNFTELGMLLRQMNLYTQIVKLIQILLSDDVIGKVYISQKVLGIAYTKEDVSEIIRECYPNYSPQIYRRRAQTVLSWVKWIDSQLAI